MTSPRCFGAAAAASRPMPGAHRQRGMVIFIALIVMVALSLAGIALLRSVDTSVVIAGNLAFKQTTIQAGDRGVAEATQWLVANSAGTTLQNTDTGNGYSSARPALEPDWNDIASWNDAVVLNGGAPDAAGNVVRYVIHRMCTEAETPYNGKNGGVENQCALAYPLSAAALGGSVSTGAPVFEGIPNLYYRVTTRVDGPRNTVSVIQSSVLIPI